MLLKKYSASAVIFKSVYFGYCYASVAWECQNTFLASGAKKVLQPLCKGKCIIHTRDWF